MRAKTNQARRRGKDLYRRERRINRHVARFNAIFGEKIIEKYLKKESPNKYIWTHELSEDYAQLAKKLS